MGVGFGVQAEVLDLTKSVLATVEESAEGWRMNDIKALLGRCNFKGEAVNKKVEVLSGGEKVRGREGGLVDAGDIVYRVYGNFVFSFFLKCGADFLV